jgi:hypothetical protein
MDLDGTIRRANEHIRLGKAMKGGPKRFAELDKADVLLAAARKYMAEHPVPPPKPLLFLFVFTVRDGDEEWSVQAAEEDVPASVKACTKWNCAHGVELEHLKGVPPRFVELLRTRQRLSDGDSVRPVFHGHATLLL